MPDEFEKQAEINRLRDRVARLEAALILIAANEDDRGRGSRTRREPMSKPWPCYLRWPGWRCTHFDCWIIHKLRDPRYARYFLDEMVLGGGDSSREIYDAMIVKALAETVFALHLGPLPSARQGENR